MDDSENENQNQVSEHDSDEQFESTQPSTEQLDQRISIKLPKDEEEGDKTSARGSATKSRKSSTGSRASKTSSNRSKEKVSQKMSTDEEKDKEVVPEEKKNPCERTEEEIDEDNELLSVFEKAMPALLAWNLRKVFLANKHRIEAETNMDCTTRKLMELYDMKEGESKSCVAEIINESKIDELMEETARLRAKHEKSLEGWKRREEELQMRLMELESQFMTDRSSCGSVRMPSLRRSRLC